MVKGRVARKRLQDAWERKKRLESICQHESNGQFSFDKKVNGEWTFAHNYLTFGKVTFSIKWVKNRTVHKKTSTQALPSVKSPRSSFPIHSNSSSLMNIHSLALQPAPLRVNSNKIAARAIRLDIDIHRSLSIRDTEPRWPKYWAYFGSERRWVRDSSD